MENLTLPNYEVQLIRGVVPPGPQGTSAGSSGTRAPSSCRRTAGWIVADNETQHLGAGRAPHGRTVAVPRLQHRDTYDHTVYLTFLVNPLTPAETTTLEDLGLLNPRRPSRRRRAGHRERAGALNGSDAPDFQKAVVLNSTPSFVDADR